MNEIRHLRNRWYVACLTSELTSKPVASRILEQPLVLFRTPSNGKTVILEDRCVHRQAPLSLGEVVNNNIQCGYHGIEYDESGACVRIPSQKQIPPGAVVRAYPCIEQQGFIHVWMGEPALCDTKSPYDFPFASNPEWRVRYAHLYGRFDSRLLIDNLMDVTHLPFAHKSTIGASGVAENAVAKTERDGERIRVTRFMEDIVPAPAHVAVTSYSENVDRWQVIEYAPPGFVWLQVGSSKAGKGGRDADPKNILLNRHTLHLAMPETNNSTLYLWVMANKTDALTSEQEGAIYDASILAFNEDILIIEGQQARWNTEMSRIDVRADVGALEVRRLMKRLIRDEFENSKLNTH